MAKKTETKELWHIPKRGNVHQTVYMVYCLSWDKFNNKAWNSSKQEAIASEMRKVGLTKSGKALSQQSVRTLLANIPKYLGFIYIDESTRPPKIVVTDVGFQLLDYHRIEETPKHTKLADYKQAGDLITESRIFCQQLTKLIITNPSIRSECKNILLFPFRMTLRLLIELEYLDIEEIAYILFHTKTEDEFEMRLERIKNFRALEPAKRQSEIDAYRKTIEGQLTLVKAASAGYYITLCVSTGLCKKTTKKINKITNRNLSSIMLKDKNEANRLINEFVGSPIYDFGENYQLWNEYYSNPKRILPPFDVSISTNSSVELLITIKLGNRIIFSDSISNKSDPITFPAFDDQQYTISGHLLSNGIELFENSVLVNRDNPKLILEGVKSTNIKAINKLDIKDKVIQMISGKYKGFDQEYCNRLNVLKEKLSTSYFDNRRKGGRLEYLLSELLKIARTEGKVDEVYWYGKIQRYGICEPAPGGKEGYPDIVFEIGDYSFVVECTTMHGNRSQWNGSEASSVPDHINNYKEKNLNKNTIGIFTAPSIHDQLKTNLMLNAQDKKVGMVFFKLEEFCDLFIEKDREDIYKHLIRLANAQISG